MTATFNRFQKMRLWLKDQGGQPQVVNTILRVAEAIGPLDFGDSTPEHWQKAYHSANPKAQRDLGAIRLQILKDCRDWWRQESAAAEAAEAAAKARAAATREPLEFTLEQLKALVAMMELCNLKIADMNSAKAFFRTFGLEEKGQGNQ